MTDTPQSLQDEFVNTAFLDTSSPHDGAVFFSGPKAKRKAVRLAKTDPDNYKTVVNTPALKAFNAYQPHYFGKNASFSLQEAYFIGDCISEYFASNATGTVHVYLDGVKPHGTFNRVELPELLENPDVTGFLVYDLSPEGGLSPDGEAMTKEKLQSYVKSCTDRRSFRGIGQSLGESLTPVDLG